MRPYKSYFIIVITWNAYVHLQSKQQINHSIFLKKFFRLVLLLKKKKRSK